MEQYFTKIAENELKHELFCHPIDYIFKPFQTTTDFISTLVSPLIAPGYFLGLTFLVLKESLFSLGYTCYFLIRHNETDSKQYLVDSKSSGKVGSQMLCLFIGIAPLMIVVFLFRLLATLVFTISKSFSLNEQIELVDNQSAITAAISRYVTLVKNVNIDRMNIIQSLKTYNTEVEAFITDKKQFQHTSEEGHHSITRFSYFQVPNEQMILLREQKINDELLGTFQELMETYPRNSLDRSSTLGDVELACSEFEEHHARVLEIANTMIPNLWGFLNMAKQMDAPKSSIMKV